MMEFSVSFQMPLARETRPKSVRSISVKSDLAKLTKYASCNSSRQYFLALSRSHRLVGQETRNLWLLKSFPSTIDKSCLHFVTFRSVNLSVYSGKLIPCWPQADHTICFWLIVVDTRRTKSTRVMNEALKIAYCNDRCFAPTGRLRERQQ